MCWQIANGIIKETQGCFNDSILIYQEMSDATVLSATISSGPVDISTF